MKKLFVILFISGCISQVSNQSNLEEVRVLDVKPEIDYYPLGGYTESIGEAFYVIAGGAGQVTKTLNEIVVQNTAQKTTFDKDDTLNLVVFRGVFNTGGHGITIDKVERSGDTFIVYAIYTDPGRGMMVTQAFTQPTAIIPIGKLPERSYEARLKVTEIIENEDGKSILSEDKEHESIAFMVN